MPAKTGSWLYRTRGLYPFLSILVILLIKFETSSRTSPIIYLASLILALCLLGFRVWAAGFMEAATRSGEGHKHTLVTAGPYAYVRNPMYLAAMLLGLLYVVISGVWYSLFIWILGYVFTYSQVIKYEEEDLHQKFGQKYEEYRSKVPRLIPALSAYDDGVGEFKLGSQTLRNAFAEMIILSAFWFLYWWL